MARVELNMALQQSLIKGWWRQGMVTLTQVAQPVVDLAGEIDSTELKMRVPRLLRREPMEDYLVTLWTTVGARYATDMTRELERVTRKSDTYDFWEDSMRRYTRERSLAMVGNILDSQAAVINDLIDSMVQDAISEGASIYDIQRAMRNEFTDRLMEITRYQAERIARTEVIGASNTGSFMAARSVGDGVRKGWSTSGLPGIRQSHLDYEAMGAVAMEYEYATGLRYPGDPDGAAEEIINCRCTPVYEVD